MSLRITGAVIATVAVMLAVATASRAETVEDAAFDAYVSRDGHKSLAFPSQPEAFGYGKASKMFKPDGAGPFPGLVILPTCAGHAAWPHSFDWAKPALARGYAVLVVDPLTPRGVGAENCNPPSRVSPARYRRDAFDAAEHLRKQPFVDNTRIGVIGLSLGAMGILGAAAEGHSAPEGYKPFRAVVAIYPICYFPNIQSILLGRRVDIRYIPAAIAVPLQVQMGELDTEAPPKDCLPMLDALKAKSAPIDYVVHKNATHNWDVAVLGSGNYTKRGPRGNVIEYRYSPGVTADSIERAFGFLDRQVKDGAPKSN